MKLTISLLLCCLANVCFSFPMRDGSKDPPKTETSSDTDSVPTAISFKELTRPSKLAIIKDNDSDLRMRRRNRRDIDETEMSPPTLSPELASTTPLVIKGAVDDDMQPPTPSEELASTTPLVIKDGDPDQWERRLRRSDEDVRAPPTIALQPGFNGTEEEVETMETTSPKHIPGPQQLGATHFMRNEKVDHIGSENQKLEVDEDIESTGKERRRRAVQDVVPDLGMPIMKSDEQQKSTTYTSSSEEEQIEDLGMPFPKVHVTHEMPKTEDESGWSRPRRFVRNKRSQDGQTAPKMQEVEMTEAPSTAPLIKDRLQIESETEESHKEVPESTEAAGAASEDRGGHLEGPKKSSTSPLIMDRIADEIKELTTETPKVRRRRYLNRRHWKEEPKPEDDGLMTTTEAPMNQEAEEPFSTEERRKRSEDGEDGRIEEIQRVLAGENIDKIENETSKRRTRSTNDVHKKPGVEAVEEAGLAATLEQQRAHIQGEDGIQMQSAGRQMEEDGKNERRYRRSASSEEELQDGRGEAGPAGGMSAGHIEPEVEQQGERGEAGPAGVMSAGRTESEEETRSNALRKRRTAIDAEAENGLHSTPDTTGKGFYEIDCKGRVFC